MLLPLIGLLAACSLLAPTDEELFDGKGAGGMGGASSGAGGMGGASGGNSGGATSTATSGTAGRS